MLFNLIGKLTMAFFTVTGQSWRVLKSYFLLVLCLWGADHLTFEGDMGDFRKNYPADWFRGKKILARKYYNWRIRGAWLWKKILQRGRCMSGKKCYYQRVGGKNSFPAKSPIPPPPINVKWSTLFLPQTRTSRSMLARIKATLFLLVLCS